MKKVKITHGLFRDEVGILSEPFEYYGETVYIVKITRVLKITGQRYIAYATVNENEFEETEVKIKYREC